MFIDTYPSVRPPMQWIMQVIQDKNRRDHISSASFSERICKTHFLITVEVFMIFVSDYVHWGGLYRQDRKLPISSDYVGNRVH